MASLLVSAFDSLSPEDFEVYAPKCWSNNLHNLDRMRTKDRLLALLNAVTSQLDGGEGLSASTTSEIPSVWNGRKVKDQWAYLIRSSEERNQIFPLLAADMGLAARIQEPSDHQRHAVVYLCIDHDHFTVGLTLHKHATIDLTNAAARSELAEVAALLEAAEKAALTLNGEAPSAAALEARARQAREGIIDEVVLCRQWPRGEALDLGEGLTETLADIFRVLVPLYDLLAWSPSNDHAGVAERLAEFASTKARHEAEAQSRMAELEAKREARAQEAQARAQERAAELAEWRARRRRPRPPMEEMGPSTRTRGSTEEGTAEESTAGESTAGESTAGESTAGESTAEEGAAALEPATSAERAGEEAPKASKPARPERPARAPRSTRPERPTRGPRSSRPPRGADRGAKETAGSDRPARKSQPRRAPVEQAAVDLKVGDSCRLLRGLFAGKEGVICALDKGLYEVKVGNLQVRVKAQELEPLG